MIAERLAEYTRSLSFARLPGEVVHEIKRRVLDSLGCALGAWHSPPARIARRLAQSITLRNGATLWGTGHRTLPDLAAFANGTLVRYLDFNDTYLSKEPAHPSDNLAAVLALGETVQATGRQIIEALTLAYEVQCRLCDAAALRPRGWDHVTYGPFSSALAAARLLKLSKAQTIHAVNLAGVANVALRQTRVGDLSMWKACAFANATVQLGKWPFRTSTSTSSWPWRSGSSSASSAVGASARRPKVNARPAFGRSHCCR